MRKETRGRAFQQIGGAWYQLLRTMRRGAEELN